MKKYYFKEKFLKITDHYPILDEDGKKAFFVDQKFKFLGYEAAISDSTDETIFTINRKLISFLPVYEINFKDSKKKMTIKSNISVFRKSIDIISESGKINVKGNLWDYEFKAYFKGDLIGEVSKKLLSLTDQYQLKVHKEDFTEELIALCISLNNIKDMENASSRNDN
ncbi:LURP-one-related/scramblase family protein [Anaerococcus sp.]|uniref:LURP-one-related/scramblase family protein n=1 Tax=Anaerococcus sp. TaxID=1872515 RepID=UPI0027B9A4C7|nr:LURP-one-related family protein [Anaerococcus sp.]